MVVLSDALNANVPAASAVILVQASVPFCTAKNVGMSAPQKFSWMSVPAAVGSVTFPQDQAESATSVSVANVARACMNPSVRGSPVYRLPGDEASSTRPEN